MRRAGAQLCGPPGGGGAGLASRALLAACRRRAWAEPRRRVQRVRRGGEGAVCYSVFTVSAWNRTEMALRGLELNLSGNEGMN